MFVALGGSDAGCRSFGIKRMSQNPLLRVFGPYSKNVSSASLLTNVQFRLYRIYGISGFRIYRSGLSLGFLGQGCRGRGSRFGLMYKPDEENLGPYWGS